MFDDKDGWWGTRVEHCRPVPVWLDLVRALPAPSRVRHDDVPLRVRAAGIDLARVLPAVLLAWHQTNVGDWLAEVRVRLTNRTERGFYDAQLFAPAAAVRPREPDDREEPRTR